MEGDELVVVLESTLECKHGCRLTEQQQHTIKEAVGSFPAFLALLEDAETKTKLLKMPGFGIIVCSLPLVQLFNSRQIGEEIS